MIWSSTMEFIYTHLGLYYFLREYGLTSKSLFNLSSSCNAVVLDRVMSWSVLNVFVLLWQVLIIFWIYFDEYILFQQSWLHTGKFSPLEDSSLIYLNEVKFLTSLSSLRFILEASIIKGQFLIIWVKTKIVFWIVLSRICVCILQKIFLGVLNFVKSSLISNTPP